MTCHITTSWSHRFRLFVMMGSAKQANSKQQFNKSYVLWWPWNKYAFGSSQIMCIGDFVDQLLLMFSFKRDRNSNQSDDRLTLLNSFAITQKTEKKNSKKYNQDWSFAVKPDNLAINSHGYGCKVGGIYLNDDINSQCNSQIENSQLQFNLLITGRSFLQML